MDVNLDEKTKGRQVIVIDYDPLVRMLLEETLVEIGFKPTSFDNARDALTHLKNINGRCSFIIVDQGLPGGIRGAEFAQIANTVWNDIPFVLTSGYLLEEKDIPSCAVYLHKPYTLKELENSIAAAITSLQTR